MNKQGVTIGISGTLALVLILLGVRFYFGNSGALSKDSETNGTEVPSLAGLESREEVPADADLDPQIGSSTSGSGSNLSVKPLNPPPVDPTQTLGTQNARVLERCFNHAHSRFSAKPSDGLDEVLNSVLAMDSLNRFVEVENLHFNDESGKPLRFQILTENESRFFRVDAEGLPIRIDPPEPFARLNPSAQKEALKNAYKTSVFSESFERYSKNPERSAENQGSSNADSAGYSMQIRRLNGAVIEMQIFYRDPSAGDLRSAGCSGDTGIRCKCL